MRTSYPPRAKAIAHARPINPAPITATAAISHPPGAPQRCRRHQSTGRRDCRPSARPGKALWRHRAGPALPDAWPLFQLRLDLADLVGAHLADRGHLAVLDPPQAEWTGDVAILVERDRA